MSNPDAIARSLGMERASEELQVRGRAAADHIMALFAGFTVQEAVSVLALCSGEVLALLARHDQTRAFRQYERAVAAHIVAQPPGNRKWSHQITPAEARGETPE